MTSRTERFERLANAVPKSESRLDKEEEDGIRFSPEEEAVRLSICLRKWDSMCQANIKLS